MDSVGTPALYAGFTLLVLALLALDLGVFHRKAHEVSLREAITWSGVWVGLALAFNALVWAWFGGAKGLEFLTGYLIEKSLAVDNIFVFVVIFSSLAVPRMYQHRVLFWGIVGALILRAGFIAAGAALLARFHGVIYVFGLLLVATGIRLVARREESVDPLRNPVLRLFRRLVPTVADYDGARFTVVRDGRRHATPLLAALVAVEITDVVFAIDSIPAIFAVTRDPFIVYTSNIFAILGLRAMYFLLEGVVQKFRYLKIGLAGVLVFVGSKMLLSDVLEVSTPVSLGVIALLLAGAIVASLRASRRETLAEARGAEEIRRRTGAA
jgi:tellurite resistance protein TerC